MDPCFYLLVVSGFYKGAKALFSIISSIKRSYEKYGQQQPQSPIFSGQLYALKKIIITALKKVKFHW